MLLLAHLLKQNPEWRNRPIRLMRVVAEEAAREDVLNHLQQLATESRIEVQANVFVSQSAQSRDRRTVAMQPFRLLGFEMPELGASGTFLSKLESFSQNIPASLVRQQHWQHETNIQTEMAADRRLGYANMA